MEETASSISEPATSGKVVVETTKGALDIELWPAEAPKAARHFVQLCLEGFFDGRPFHRVLPGLLAQTGGDGSEAGFGATGVESTPRLRFRRRGLVAMADDEHAQWFVTLGECRWLDRKHSIFGTVVGDTRYNLVRLDDGEIGENDRPVVDILVLKTTVVTNPFADLKARPDRLQRAPEKKKEGEEEDGDSSGSDGGGAGRKRGVRNAALLSFHDGAGADGEEPEWQPAKKKPKTAAHNDDDDDDDDDGSSSSSGSESSSSSSEEDEKQARVRRARQEEMERLRRDIVRARRKPLDDDDDDDKEKEREKGGPSALEQRQARFAAMRGARKKQRQEKKERGSTMDRLAAFQASLKREKA